jgi:GNAT superfamily N-acetyltransferase
MLDIVIHDLADFPHWLPMISGWFHTEWRDIYGDLTQADIERRIGNWLKRDRIPTALVAVVDGEAVGTVALKDKEPQLGMSPWLVGLYVVPRFRHCGIGTQLLRAAENKARSIGLSKLYLYTPNYEGFYGAYGWSLQQEAALYAGKVKVMEKLLTPHNLFQPLPLARRG